MVCLMKVNGSSMVLVFKMDRERVSASAVIKYQVTELSVHPLRNREILLLGEKQVRLWTINLQEKSLKDERHLLASKELKNLVVISHQWIS